jgi:serine/threonine-protein kinase
MSAPDGDERDDPRFQALKRRVAAIDPGLRALPEIGQVVGGKYRIEALLGRGGLGGVFRAVQLADGRPIALKWLLHSTPNRRSHHRLLKESLTNRALQLANVVAAYDLGREGHFTFVTMELLQGESLRERLRRGPLPIAECVRLLLPPMRDLLAMHRAHVFHRAITPDSFFLCTGPDGAARAKLIDLGVANVIEELAGDDDAIRDVLPYMAFEQLERASEVGGTADVYACGAVLYEALTGSRPFAAQTRAELQRALATSRPRDPKELRPDLPSGLRRVLLRALGKRREDRYPTLEALIAALAPFASERRARGQWLWVVAAAALLAMLLTLWFLQPSLAHTP